MLFASQFEAKEFLVNKIVAEAARQNAPLSSVERQLLFFSEQEPGSDGGLTHDVLAENDIDFEKKVTNLLIAAFKRDQENQTERQRYNEAMQTLKKGDHYLLVMAEPAFARMHRGRDILIYIAIGLAVVGAALAFAMLRS